MGRYAVLKEKVINLTNELNNLNEKDHEHDFKEQMFSLQKRINKYSAEITSMGRGSLFRVDTPKGHLYLVGVDKQDVMDILKDVKLDKYALITELDTMKLTKS